MTSDPEIMAMVEISRALDGVSEEARVRVVNWLLQKYGREGSAGMSLAPQSSAAITSQQFSDFASFFNTANPAGQTEAALVAGYWLQVYEHQNDWDSPSANTLLKNVGQPMSNISETLTRLTQANPRLVMQTAKGGMQQGKKRYKLTIQGMKKVQGMLVTTGQ
jgi:hypothetical protein